MKRILTVLLILPGPMSAPNAQADWPQLLGPKRDGHASKGVQIIQTIEAAGVKEVWSRNIGRGFAGPAVSGGILILHHRLGVEDVVEAMSTKTGKTIWKDKYPAEYRDGFGFDPGPRAVPTIDAGRVYTHGAQGRLICWNIKTGKRVWEIQTKKVFQSPKGYFGRACSPVIAGKVLMLQIGAPGNGIVGFDKTTGKKLWAATEHEAGYSSPIVAKLNGKIVGIFLTREGLVILDVSDGKVLVRRRFRSDLDATVNAATPVIRGNQVFLSAEYDVGAIMFEVGKSWSFKKIWQSERALSNHYSTSVRIGDYLYGFHGRQETGQRLRCVAWATGKVMWESPDIPAGMIIAADGKLIIVNERGELILVRVNEKRFAQLGKADILNTGGRAYAALSKGYLFARDKRTLKCLDIRRPVSKP